MNKKILHIDMDGVIVDFKSALEALGPEIVKEWGDKIDEYDGLFSLMKPMPGAIESVEVLAKHFDVYILTTAPWNNPSAWRDKLLWIKKYLPEVAYKRLTITHSKHHVIGDYLIDDRFRWGVDKFSGEHIHFGTEKFPDWNSILDYLAKKRGPASTQIA